MHRQTTHVLSCTLLHSLHYSTVTPPAPLRFGLSRTAEVRRIFSENCETLRVVDSTVLHGMLLGQFLPMTPSLQSQPSANIPEIMFSLRYLLNGASEKSTSHLSILPGESDRQKHASLRLKSIVLKNNNRPNLRVGQHISRERVCVCMYMCAHVHRSRPAIYNHAVGRMCKWCCLLEQLARCVCSKAQIL